MQLYVFLIDLPMVLLRSIDIRITRRYLFIIFAKTFRVNYTKNVLFICLKFWDFIESKKR